MNSENARVANFNYPSTAALVAKHIENLILSGVIRPGERLPPERLLADQLDVSRTVLRSALKTLVAKDLLRTTQGGGNYVSELLGAQMTDPIAGLLRENPRAMDDFMEFRCELEGSSAYLAAMRATAPDLQALEMILEGMEHAHRSQDTHAESMLDADFHMAIAELSHNVIIVQIAHSLQVLMQQELLNTRIKLFDDSNGTNGENGRRLVLEQHRNIFIAISERDSEKSKQAMQQHIRYVRGKLREIATLGERDDIGRRRLDRWLSRLTAKGDGQ